MKKSKKAKPSGAKQDEPPWTFLQQAQQQPRFGMPDWFEQRRKRFPKKGHDRPAQAVALSKDLMKRSPGKRYFDPFVPDEAPIMPTSPCSIGHPQHKWLRRFSGAKVQAAQFTQIYNGESRTVYRDTTFPWVCIGQLTMPDGTQGSAALIGRNSIVTAAHNLDGFWSAGSPLTTMITFVPAMFDGTSLLGATWTASVINIAAWEQGDPGQQGYDMAVCQLNQPMGEWLGAFGAQEYSDDWEDQAVWTHAGYPYDLSASGARPCYELGIAVRDDDSDSYNTLEIETRADIASGQSGGPLWGVFGGRRRIIGVLSGREDQPLQAKNSLFAGGRGLVELVRWARDNWG